MNLNLDFLVSLIMFLTAIFYGCVLPYSFFPGGLIHMPSFSYHLYAAATTAKSLQSCLTLCDPIDSSPPGFPKCLGFSRQEHWSGLPFPSPKHESEVTQSCPTLSDPMDCSLLGSSIHGIFQARVLEWGAIAFSTYMLITLKT